MMMMVVEVVQEAVSIIYVKAIRITMCYLASTVYRHRRAHAARFVVTDERGLWEESPTNFIHVAHRRTGMPPV